MQPGHWGFFLSFPGDSHVLRSSMAWSLGSEWEAGRPGVPGAAGPGRGESHMKLPVPLLHPPLPEGTFLASFTREQYPDVQKTFEIIAFLRGARESRRPQVTEQNQGCAHSGGPADSWSRLFSFHLLSCPSSPGLPQRDLRRTGLRVTQQPLVPTPGSATYGPRNLQSCLLISEWGD